MFVTMLEPTQREALLQAAAFMIEADGRSPEVERDLLQAINLEAGMEHIPAAPVEQATLLDTLRECFGDTPVPARVLLLELAGVAVVDGHTDQAELALLQQVSEAVGLSPELLDEALAFANDARNLAQRGRDFVVSDAA